MLKICLAFWKSEPQYAYKRYAYKNMYVSSKFKYFYNMNEKLSWDIIRVTT